MTLIDTEPYSRRIIGCAIEAHKTFGPGLTESRYEAALCRELDIANRDIANPGGSIISAAMLLHHGLEASQEAAVVYAALDFVRADGDQHCRAAGPASVAKSSHRHRDPAPSTDRSLLRSATPKTATRGG